MGRTLSERPISRRDILFAASLGLAACSLAYPPRETKAYPIASNSYPQNEKLTPEAISERFRLINASYSIGDPFDSEDVDFVLRYGLSAPSGAEPRHTERTLVLTTTNNPLSIDQTVDFSYGGMFTYSFKQTLEINADQPIEALDSESELTVYGWISPYHENGTMCAFGIVQRLKQSNPSMANLDANTKLHWELGTGMVGIAAAFHIENTFVVNSTETYIL